MGRNLSTPKKLETLFNTKNPNGNNTSVAPVGVTAKADAQAAAQAAAALPKGRVQSWRKWLVVLTLLLSDILLAFLVWGAASLPHKVLERGELTDLAVASIVPNVGVWVGLRALMGLYPGYGMGAVEELRRQSYSVGATLAIVAIFALTFQVGDLLSRLLLGLGFLTLLVVSPLVRYLIKRRLLKLGMWGKPVAILGAGETGAQLVRSLQSEWGLGFRPVAVFDFHMAPSGGVLEEVPYGGTVNDALDLAHKHRLDTAIFAMPHIRREYLASFVEGASRSFRHVIVVPNLLGVTNSAVVARDLAGVFGVEIKHNLLNPWALRAKRLLELGATVVGGTLILPFLLMISLLIWLDSPGRVLYGATRVGRDGKYFRCLKFRTMVPDAEARLQQVLEEDQEKRQEYSKYHKLREDPRVTRVGHFLRRTSLDELPQLWNVVRGEMSLVGPRPIVQAEIDKYGKSYDLYKQVIPGITGLWQVSGRNDTSYEERVTLDTYYVRNWSVWLDLIILARTMKSVLLGRGAY